MSSRSGLTVSAKTASRKRDGGMALPATSEECAPSSKMCSAAKVERNRGRGWLVALCVFAALSLGLGSLWIARNAHARTMSELPSEKASPHFVAAPGLVESVGGLRELAFEVPGRLKAVLVEEGESVKKGQILAELDGDHARARLNAAKADLRVAEAQLSVLQGNLDAELLRAEREVDRLRAGFERLKAGPRSEELDRARAEAKAAEIEWKRRVEDARKYENYPSISSKQDRDMTQGLAEITHAQFRAADAKLRELQTGTRKEDLAQAEAQFRAAEADFTRVTVTREPRVVAAKQQVEQGKARQMQADAEIRKTVLEAPIDGVVVWKFKHPGETVGVLPPERIVTVADVSTLRVRADVDEADFAKIRPGQKVRVTAEAFGDKAFIGRVERVSAAAGQKRFSTGEAKERQDVKVIETIVTFDSTPPFKLGLRVTVRFELEER